MNIDIKGHSGCNVSIIEENDTLFIEKSTNDPKYLDRLSLQADKQIKAFQELKGNNLNIKVPEIINTRLGDDKYEIIMEYVYSKNYIEFFERATTNEIRSFTDALINYVKHEINTSEIKSVDISVFIDKVKSVKENCKKNPLISDNNYVYKLIDKAIKLLSRYKGWELPVGTCHGDLTFSNILFSNTGSYYLIDFLDSFVETPLQDIVKIRQDSQFLWSILMYNKKFDRARIKMISAYIDKKIDSEFRQYEWYRDLYDLMQIINILRILPYVKKGEVAEYLINILTDLLLYGEF